MQDLPDHYNLKEAVDDYHHFAGKLAALKNDLSRSRPSAEDVELGPKRLDAFRKLHELIMDVGPDKFIPLDQQADFKAAGEKVVAEIEALLAPQQREWIDHAEFYDKKFSAPPYIVHEFDDIHLHV